VANVSHSQDNIEVLKITALDEIIAGLRVIANGGRFIVGHDFKLSFNSLNAEQPTKYYHEGFLPTCKSTTSGFPSFF
jgi:hypothetical protein